MRLLRYRKPAAPRIRTMRIAEGNPEALKDFLNLPVSGTRGSREQQIYLRRRSSDIVTVAPPIGDGACSC
jgi:hypothetical protein